jgi:tetratricopeptide (TPR) repeat protein
MDKVGRNDPCPCNSGKKYKKCCGQGADAPAARTPALLDLGPLAVLMRAHRYAELEQSARSLLESHGNNGVLWKLLGTALYGQRKDHLPALEMAVQLLPNDPEAHTSLGNTLRARGRFDEAAACHRQAIAIRADYAEAHNNLGSVLRDLGRVDDAKESYARAIALKPDFAMAHDNLGIVLYMLGQAEEAMAAHRRALAMAPDFAEAHAHLGDALNGAGRLEEAAASYRRAVMMKPEQADVLLKLANIQFALGRFELAVTNYRRLLQLRPHLAEAHSNLGNALRECGQAQAAVESYRAALELQPDCSKIHNNLGNALLDVGRIEDAAGSYRRAIELEPDYTKAHANLGTALRELGRLDQAAASLHRALQLAPDSVEVLISLAGLQRLQADGVRSESNLRRALELDPAASGALVALGELAADKGRFGEAEDLYRQAFALNADSAPAWAGIASVKRMSADDSAWADEAQRLASKSLVPRVAAVLHFALGKYFDDIKDYEQAFANFRRANEVLKTCGPPHDREQLAQMFEFTRQLYDEEFVNLARARGEASTLPVFIVGMPRSGTSLAEQILASHPEVFGAGELSYWKSASLAAAEAALKDGPNPDLSARLAENYLKMLAALAPERTRIVDKMPGNFIHLGMIHSAMPDARIIHMRRNPMDTCLSMYFQNFQIAHSYTKDLHDLAHYYNEYQDLMLHWKKVLPAGAILEVPYEALVEDPETWSRKMIDFVGLEWNAACLDFYQTDRTVGTFSRWQVRQRISRSSVQRWRNYEPFIAPLLRLAPLGAAA